MKKLEVAIKLGAFHASLLAAASIGVPAEVGLEEEAHADLTNLHRTSL